MNKKVAIALICVLILVGVVVICVMRNTDNSNEELPLNQNEISGDIHVHVSGEEIIEEIIESEYPPIFPIEDRRVFLDEQIVRLEEIEEKNLYWTYTIDDPSIVEINSDEKELKYFEYMVGAVYDRLYKLKGLKEGETSIKFNSTYSVNGENKDFESVEYWVVVNEENKIAIYTEQREELR